ncbi:hypothetical protein OIU85_021987 [Salix viminalis]|uniref:Uncharacterized protein n=1 Tax=Salix viminalis TaxID=40686 RepID=A0A9Q0UJH7_SALVM|nr:hypothetical protein OIU85_021987 [Salix viminalis]
MAWSGKSSGCRVRRPSFGEQPFWPLLDVVWKRSQKAPVGEQPLGLWAHMGCLRLQFQKAPPGSSPSTLGPMWEVIGCSFRRPYLGISLFGPASPRPSVFFSALGLLACLFSCKASSLLLSLGFKDPL